MKFIFAFFTFTLFFSSYGQTVKKLKKEGDKKFSYKYYKGAIDDYTVLLNQDTTIEDVYFNRGNCYFQLKEFVLAKNDLLKVLAFNSNRKEVYFLMPVGNFATI
ncbi:MAG: tetratricopeptide repeat protein [Flavobacteriia bacterium]|nr:tetratricopeptide repeat protein [Flavobacteriia bacterium]